MTKKISGAEYPLSKIFSADFDYVIPSYQRPYAWTVDEAGELFDDLSDFFASQPDDSYFLGSIVLIKDEGQPRAEVIDGQQRLTTLTIMLAAVASLLSGRIRDDFESFVLEPGRPALDLVAKPRLALRERDRDFFADYVQALRFDDLIARDPAQLDNEAQRNIRANAELLRERLRSTFGNDPTRIGKFGSFLVQRTYLVAVSTPSQQSAFRVFSVLNSRGLDLLPTDIIKADVIGKVAAANRDQFNDRWEELEIQTGRAGFVELFGHIRMIRAKSKAQRSLLEEFKKFVTAPASSAEAVVTDIIAPYADAYLDAKHSRYRSTSNADRVNQMLGWLNRIDNADWLPPAILFLATQRDHPEYVAWFFEKLERLAAFMHLCAKNVNERIERFAQVLTALEGSHSPTAPVAAVNLSSDEKTEMLATLGSAIYMLTARRRNYLILRLDSFLGDGAASYDPTVLTIEHVLPQTVDPKSEWATTWPDLDERARWVHAIANLVPLTQRKNSMAHNFDFNKKKATYFSNRAGVTSYRLATQVLNTNDWLPQTVSARQKMLLGVLSEKWELN